MTLTNRLEEIVEACAKDLEGDTSQFWDDMKMRTIRWYVSRTRTIVYYAGMAPKRERGAFLEAIGKREHIKLRRIQEAISVYEKFYVKGDGVGETAQKIFEAYGGWSKAVAQLAPPKPVEAAEEHTHIFICKCGKQLQP